MIKKTNCINQSLFLSKQTSRCWERGFYKYFHVNEKRIMNCSSNCFKEDKYRCKK